MYSNISPLSDTQLAKAPCHFVHSLYSVYCLLSHAEAFLISQGLSCSYCLCVLVLRFQRHVQKVLACAYYLGRAFKISFIPTVLEFCVFHLRCLIFLPYFCASREIKSQHQHAYIQFSQHRQLKWLPFLQCVFLTLLSKIKQLQLLNSIGPVSCCFCYRISVI